MALVCVCVVVVTLMMMCVVKWDQFENVFHLHKDEPYDKDKDLVVVSIIRRVVTCPVCDQ
jgi:uncharacterized membrane protein YidH (DUF202 family)